MTRIQRIDADFSVLSAMIRLIRVIRVLLTDPLLQHYRRRRVFVYQ